MKPPPEDGEKEGRGRGTSRFNHQCNTDNKSLSSADREIKGTLISYLKGFRLCWWMVEVVDLWAGTNPSCFFLYVICYLRDFYVSEVVAFQDTLD